MLKSLAGQTGQPISEHIRDAVTKYFSDLEENKQDLQMAIGCLARGGSRRGNYYF